MPENESAGPQGDRHPGRHSHLEDTALDYAARGWPVFPCSPGMKVPLGRLVPHGLKDATVDPEVIVRWWTLAPGANVAIATGAPGPDVVDFDVAAGKPGMRSLARLREVGLMAGSLGTVRTPSGGIHVYWSGSEQGNGAMARYGVDFRGRGGYVVAPPSRVGGKPYELIGFRESADTVDFAAVRAFLEPPRPAPAPRRDGGVADFARLVEWVAELPEGNRNGGLYWAARRARETGAGAGVFADLIAAATRCGLSEDEARRTVRSAYRAGAGR